MQTDKMESQYTKRLQEIYANEVDLELTDEEATEALRSLTDLAETFFVDSDAPECLW